MVRPSARVTDCPLTRRAGLLLKDIAKVARPAVGHGKGGQLEKVVLQDEARGQVGQCQADGRAMAAKDDSHQRLDPVEGPLAAIDLHLLDRLPAGKSRGQPRQPQDMVQVAVGEEDCIQAAKAQAAAQQLTLGALAAVDEKAILAVHHHRRRQAAPQRGCRGRRTKKDKFEHGRIVAQKGGNVKHPPGHGAQGCCQVPESKCGQHPKALSSGPSECPSGRIGPRRSDRRVAAGSRGQCNSPAVGCGRPCPSIVFGLQYAT